MEDQHEDPNEDDFESSLNEALGALPKLPSSEEIEEAELNAKRKRVTKRFSLKEDEAKILLGDAKRAEMLAKDTDLLASSDNEVEDALGWESEDSSTPSGITNPVAPPDQWKTLKRKSLSDGK